MFLTHSSPETHPSSTHHGLCQEYSLFTHRMPTWLCQCNFGGYQRKELETSPANPEYTSSSNHASVFSPMRPHQHIQHAEGASLAAGQVENRIQGRHYDIQTTQVQWASISKLQITSKVPRRCMRSYANDWHLEEYPSRTNIEAWAFRCPVPAILKVLAYHIRCAPSISSLGAN